MQKVASSFFNNAADVSIEMLRVAADVFEVAPILGVAEAARVLLSIWQGVQSVEVCFECNNPNFNFTHHFATKTNRLSCLRLTERCATILYSVRSEINAAGPDVADVLQEPMAKLLE
jgi:abelson tyrosine-protein kinase 1